MGSCASTEDVVSANQNHQSPSANQNQQSPSANQNESAEKRQPKIEQLSQNPNRETLVRNLHFLRDRKLKLGSGNSDIAAEFQQSEYEIKQVKDDDMAMELVCLVQQEDIDYMAAVDCLLDSARIPTWMLDKEEKSLKNQRTTLMGAVGTGTENFCGQLITRFINGESKVFKDVIFIDLMEAQTMESELKMTYKEYVSKFGYETKDKDSKNGDVLKILDGFDDFGGCEMYANWKTANPTKKEGGDKKTLCGWLHDLLLTGKSVIVCSGRSIENYLGSEYKFQLRLQLLGFNDRKVQGSFSSKGMNQQLERLRKNPNVYIKTYNPSMCEVLTNMVAKNSKLETEIDVYKSLLCSLIAERSSFADWKPNETDVMDALECRLSFRSVQEKRPFSQRMGDIIELCYNMSKSSIGFNYYGLDLDATQMQRASECGLFATRKTEDSSFRGSLRVLDVYLFIFVVACYYVEKTLKLAHEYKDSSGDLKKHLETVLEDAGKTWMHELVDQSQLMTKFYVTMMSRAEEQIVNDNKALHSSLAGLVTCWEPFAAVNEIQERQGREHAEGSDTFSDESYVLHQNANKLLPVLAEVDPADDKNAGNVWFQRYISLCKDQLVDSENGTIRFYGERVETNAARLSFLVKSRNIKDLPQKLTISMKDYASTSLILGNEILREGINDVNISTCTVTTEIGGFKNIQALVLFALENESLTDIFQILLNLQLSKLHRFHFIAGSEERKIGSNHGEIIQKLLEALENVRSLKLEGCKADFSKSLPLDRMKNLTELDLTGNKMTDSDLEAVLGTLPESIKTLKLSFNRLKFAKEQYKLKQMRELEYLDISGDQDDKCLQHLNNVFKSLPTQLKKLELPFDWEDHDPEVPEGLEVV